MNLFSIKNKYSITFLANIFIQVCTVLQGALLARYLGPVGRGEFLTVTLWPTVFAGIGILGVNTSIARLAGVGHNKGDLESLAIFLGLVTGFCSLVICALFLPFLIPINKHYLLNIAYLFLAFIPINHLSLMLIAIDQGEGNFNKLGFIRSILYPVYFLGLCVSWIFAINKILWMTIALLLANALVAIIQIILKFELIHPFKLNINIKHLIEITKPYMMASLFSILYTQLDKILLIWLMSPKEIGFYIAAFSAAATINIISISIGTVQFTISANSEHHFGFPQIAIILRRCVLISFSCAMILSLVLPFLVPLVYGEAFRDSILISQLLLPGLIFTGLSGIVNEALSGQGRPLSGFYTKAFGLFVFVFVGCVFSGYFGSKGIALGLFASELVVFLGMILVAKGHYEDFSWAELCPRFSDITFVLQHIKK